MAATIVSNSTAATFGNSPQKTGEPLDHATLFSGKALEFDGVTDYLDTNFEISADANATPDVDHTIAIWAKMNVGGAYMALFTSRKTAGSSNVGTGIEIKSNDKARIGVQDGTSHAQAEGTTNFADLQWHRVVGVCDRAAGTIKIYVDGALEATTSSVAAGEASYYNNREMGIGVYDVTLVSGLSGYFNGLLCDAQLWHKCWELSDVQYDYENPESLITDNASVTAGITTSDLKLWYPMNDTGVRSPQTVVFDAAGTNNTTKNHATTTFLGDELVTNGDCEAAVPTINSQAHSLVDSASFAQSAEQENGGSNSGKVTADSSSTAPLVKWGDGSDIGLVSGRTYRVSVDVYRPTASGTTMILRVLASDGGTQLVNETTTTADDWVTLTGDFTDADIHSINIFLSGGDVSNDVYYIDNLSLKEVGIASGWTDADQQQTIPQTALMSGSSRMMFGGDGSSGDEYAETATSNDLMPDAANYSFNFWVFLSDYNQALTGAIDDSLLIVPNELKIFNDQGYLKVYCDGSSSNAVFKSGVFTANGWYHIAVVYDGGETSATDKIKLYKNGELIASTSSTGTIPTTLGSTSKKIRIGSDHIWISQALTGTMDEISMWNASLTAAQVLALYNSGTPLNATKSAAVSNLHGYWRNNHLNSDGKWEDLSTNTFHATVTESGTVYSFFQEGISANLDSQGMNTNIDHPSGGAVYFDGVNSYINAGSNNTIDDIWRSSATVEFWIKPMSATAADRVMDKKPVGTNGWYIALDDVSGATCDIKLVCDATTTDSTQITASKEIALHQWNHVAIVYDGSVLANTATIYVGGGSSNAVPASKTVTSTNPGVVPLLTDAGNDLAIGGRSGTESANSFDGLIDEVRIYNRALTLAEVTKNYNHGKGKHSN